MDGSGGPTTENKLNLIFPDFSGDSAQNMSSLECELSWSERRGSSSVQNAIRAQIAQNTVGFRKCVVDALSQWYSEFLAL